MASGGYRNLTPALGLNVATPTPQATTGPEGDPITLSAVYLHPAQMHVATAPCAIKTLLGSCVAVCLWDAEAKVGGVVHYLLPRGRHSRGETGRYGSLAIPALVKAVCALGGQPASLKAKIFGGAKVLAALANASGASLGDSNAAVAWEILAVERIPVIASDVGGDRGRRVLFHIEDGSAWVWRLNGP
jgi:chemotaxis protein CheD